MGRVVACLGDRRRKVINCRSGVAQHPRSGQGYLGRAEGAEAGVIGLFRRRKREGEI